MKLTQTLFIAAALSGFATYTSAQTTFTFHDGSATTGTGLVFDDAEGSVQDTQGSFTLTAEAFLDGVSAGTDFNGAGSSFGINATGSDSETQRFDNSIGVETMVFSFDIAGTFDSIDLRFIEDSENEAQLVFAGGPTFELNLSTDTGGTADNFNIGQSFAADQLITLQFSPLATATTENFSLESFTVSAVPEPGTYALLAGISALAFVMARRRK